MTSNEIEAVSKNLLTNKIWVHMNSAQNSSETRQYFKDYSRKWNVKNTYKTLQQSQYYPDSKSRQGHN